MFSEKMEQKKMHEIKEESGRELTRFLEWIKNNPADWYCLTNPECSEPSIERCQSIINGLIDNGLYAMGFFALCTLGYPTAEMERVNHRLKMECLAEVPVEVLIDRIKGNLEHEVNEGSGTDR